ncbi:MAG: DNA replication/repair protein RecF [Hyphomicrobiales bacterium]
MYLKKLSLTDFKSYEFTEVDLCSGINCFIGKNATGKTNILDAIYYLSFCKSYFNPQDSQNVQHGKDFFAIHADFDNDTETGQQVSCIFKKGQKKIFKYNQKEYKKLSEHIGLIPLVLISPYDRDLINEGSDVRRKFIDGVISQFNKTYLNLLLDYNKALMQRNSLLKSFAESHYFDLEALQIWDQSLSDIGGKIHKYRKEFVTEFLDLFQHYYSHIAGSHEKVSIEYKSDLHETDLHEVLKLNVERDKALKYTSRGIHKDDLTFKISGYPIKKFGSQGQQKSFVIAIKLAQLEFIKREKGFYPILLLDDIFDKLDEERVEKIIHLIGDNEFGQVFITDTSIDRIKKVLESTHLEHQLMKVETGIVSKI